MKKITTRLFILAAVVLSASCGITPISGDTIGTCGAIAGLKATSDSQLYATELFSGLIYHVNGQSGETNIIAENLVTPHGIELFEDPAQGIQEAYVTEILAGRITKVNLLTGETEVAFPGVDFLLPARIVGLVENKEFLVTEPLLGSIVKVEYDEATDSWGKSTIVRGLAFVDGITLLDNGDAIAGTFSPFGSLAKVNLQEGTVYDDILKGSLVLPITILTHPNNPNAYFVSEAGATRISLIDHQCGQAPEAECTTTRDKVFSAAVPSGLAYGVDQNTNHNVMYVADGLFGRIMKVDLDDEYNAEILSVFRCTVEAE